jgi:hypothetical protein
LHFGGDRVDLVNQHDPCRKPDYPSQLSQILMPIGLPVDVRRRAWVRRFGEGYRRPEVTTGGHRRLTPGDVMFIEGTSERGHRTRNTVCTRRYSVLVRATGEDPSSAASSPADRESLG